MSNQDFLLELGCEELPQHSQLPLANQLKEKITQLLIDARIDFSVANVFATPRRIAVLVKDMAEKQVTENETEVDLILIGKEVLVLALSMLTIKKEYQRWPVWDLRVLAVLVLTS